MLRILARCAAGAIIGGVAAAPAFAGGGPCSASCSNAGPQVAQAGWNAAAPTADIVGTAVAAGNFNTLVAAAQAAGLVPALTGPGPITVFAPTDEAFARLPAGTVESLLKPENKARLAAILTYHVVPGRVMAADVVKLNGAVTLNGQRIDIKTQGGSVMVDGARVIKTDIAATNGVIHVIDAVILPSEQNIVETAQSAGSFGTLLAAAKAAGLVGVLTGEGPLTVLAPTDEAFAKLPPGTLENLLKPENKAALANIIKFHVIPGRIYAADALKAGRAATVVEQDVRFTSEGGVAKVNGAKIIATDLDASNGVIHVIDTVLLPK